MEIAVLMSTYNGQKYLERQLQSLAEQTVAKNVTIYVRDDNSTDNTIEIIQKWKRRLRIVLYSGENVGPAKSFWDLLMDCKIKADYYAFCDQDDVWDSDKLEMGLNTLKEDTHLYVCNCRVINENEKIIMEKRTKGMPNLTLKSIFMGGCPQGCSMLFTEALRNYLCNCSINCVPMHDIIVILYALTFGKIYWDETPRFGYRVHENNVVAQNNKTKISKLKTKVWNWKNSSQNSMAIVSKDLLINAKCLSEDEKMYLQKICKYKNSILVKNNLIWDSELKKINSKSARSYRMKILLNLF